MNHQNLTAFTSRVIDVRPLAGNIVELKLARPDSFHWQAGDYLWLGIDDNDLKPFSIANVPTETTDVIHCDVAITDGLLGWWNALLQASDCVIKGPVNQYAWPQGNLPIMLLAGGTGISPLLALLKAHQSELNQRVVTLYWGVRRAELLFVKDQLDQLALDYPKFHWQAIISDEDETWQGAKGNLPDAVMSAVSHMSHYHWLICGPWPMVKMLKNWLQDQSVDATQIQ